MSPSKSTRYSVRSLDDPKMLNLLDEDQRFMHELKQDSRLTSNHRFVIMYSRSIDDSFTSALLQQSLDLPMSSIHIILDDLEEYGYIDGDGRTYHAVEV